MAESYLEKRKRILKEQKKRFEAKKMTGGAGDASVPRKRPKKKSTSKLAALPISGKSKRMQKSKSRLNPSVDYSKTPKAPKGTIKKSSLGARNRPTGQAPTTKNITKSALGAKPPAKKTEKFSSFGAAFRAARKKLGTGKFFTYKGKKYSTVTKSELKGMSLKDYLNKLKKKG
tara:strand:- start:130 stop:648 length:519 start_codon:yes stop_codon:yes gene_type:complete